MVQGLPDIARMGQSVLNLPTEVMNVEMRQIQEKMNLLNANIQNAGLPPIPVPAEGQALGLPPLPGLPGVGQTGVPDRGEVEVQDLRRNGSKVTETPSAYVDY